MFADVWLPGDQHAQPRTRGHASDTPENRGARRAADR
jgi:hypothetical protein